MSACYENPLRPLYGRLLELNQVADAQASCCLGYSELPKMIPKLSLHVHLLNKTEFFRRTPHSTNCPPHPLLLTVLRKRYTARSKVLLTPRRQEPRLSTTKQKSWLLTPVPLKSERGVVWVL